MLTPATGNGHDGTISGAGTSYVAGQFGQALNFTGSQVVQVPYSSAFALTSFTVSAWVNLASSGASGGAIMGTRFPATNNTFDLKAYSSFIHGDVGTGPDWINTSVDIKAGVLL